MFSGGSCLTNKKASTVLYSAVEYVGGGGVLKVVFVVLNTPQRCGNDKASFPEPVRYIIVHISRHVKKVHFRFCLHNGFNFHSEVRRAG